MRGIPTSWINFKIYEQHLLLDVQMNQVLEDLASAAEELAVHHSQDGDQVYLSVQDMREFTSQVGHNYTSRTWQRASPP